MPDDLSFLDQLESWLEAQVPNNLHELPYRMLETMERVSNELFETLNIHGPPSISIPFPPFHGKEVPPPPPPPSHAWPMTLYRKADKVARAHPYVVGTGAALVVSAGLSLGYRAFKGRSMRRGYGTQGSVQDGMLKDAIVILSPSPMPPLLWSLSVTLLRAGYVVLVAVPHVDDAEALEKRLGVLADGLALRVLIYDPEDPATFPPFHRSLLATLTLRFPAPSFQGPSETYNPQPNHLAHIHAFISLYALNPSPPSQPGALPALPTLLSPDQSGKTPILVNIYPSASLLVQPDAFASQLVTLNHILLGKNLAASGSTRVVSLFLGHVDLPPLPKRLTDGKLVAQSTAMSPRSSFKHDFRSASWPGKAIVVKDALLSCLMVPFTAIARAYGYSVTLRDYVNFERSILRSLKHRRRGTHFIGQYASLPLFLNAFSTSTRARLLSILPTLSSPTGPPQISGQGIPPPRRPLGPKSKTPKAPTAGSTSRDASASSSDQESGEDLGASIHSMHSGRSAHSGKSVMSGASGLSGASGISGVSLGSEGESAGSGTGLDESWAQLDASE